MLQISNIEDGRSEWNINETHIIIPMIDGDVTNKESEKILTSTLTLNSLEGGDQTILTNTLEHSLVIGLDKNLFETPSYKNDLVIIQNSDLKLLSCNSDLKNPVAYTLSYVDQDKSETLWQSSLPKDRICASEKAILEVRDVLNYDDSVHELEKNEQEINLDSVDSDIASQVTKTGAEILVEDAVAKEKRESQFITYYSSSQNGEADPVLSHLNETKYIDNNEVVENKKLFGNEDQSEPDVGNAAYKLGNNAQKNILNVTEALISSSPIKLVEYVKHKTDKKEKTITSRNKETKEINKGKLNVEGVSNFLPEKSLPLKKKAKMKRTLVSFSSENWTSLLKHDVAPASHVNLKSPMERKIRSLLTTNLQREPDTCNSNSDEHPTNKVTKRKKAIKFKTSAKKPAQKSILSPITQEDENDLKKHANNTSGDDATTKVNFCNFDRSKFNNIYDLVECLRKYRVINATVWQTLNSGLKEMKVDILKEMNAKISDTYSLERTHYSPQLKAFALVLYFKQPAAFNHLSQVYKAGWPSLNVIKEWKRRMNSHQRPNFIRAERDARNGGKS